MLTLNPNELASGGGLFSHPKFSIFTNEGIENRRKLLVTNGSLTRDEGLAIDQAVKTIQRRAFPMLDLFGRYNLIRPLGGLGFLMDEYTKRSQFTAAEASMDGRTRAKGDKADLLTTQVPLPIYHKEFSLNVRELLASRQRGTPLDTAGVEEATRVVAELVEDTIVNGSSVVFNGKAIQGLTNLTARNTGALTAVWTNAALRDILKDARAMKQALFADGAYGPYALVVPDAYWTELEDDYKAYANTTYIDRLKKIEGIVEVLPAQKLAAGNVVLVDLNRSSLDYSQALPLQVVPWESNDGMDFTFKVMMAGAPRLKSDYDGNSGIAHYS